MLIDWSSNTTVNEHISSQFGFALRFSFDSFRLWTQHSLFKIFCKKLPVKIYVCIKNSHFIHGCRYVPDETYRIEKRSLLWPIMWKSDTLAIYWVPKSIVPSFLIVSLINIVYTHKVSHAFLFHYHYMHRSECWILP